MQGRTIGTGTPPSRPHDGGMLVIDPPRLADQLRGERAWREEPRASVTLEHDGPMRIVLTSLHRDATMVLSPGPGRGRLPPPTSQTTCPGPGPAQETSAAFAA